MLHITRLRSADDPLFARAMELYSISFPIHEQREGPSQRRIMPRDQYHFGLIEEDDEFCGIILYWDTEAYIYVEHFCMLPHLRGRGLGAQTLRLMARENKPVILEIDPPADDLSRRRKAFYERAGFVENPYPHVHPPYHAGCKGHPLVVMSMPRPITQAEYDAFARHLADTVMA